MPEEFKLGGNGAGDTEGADEQEELRAAKIKLESLTRNDGVLVSLTKQDLSLLKSLLNAPDTADEFSRIVLICDFLDEEEANRELDAFYEAVRLGMDTHYNVSHALSRAVINRKGSHSSSRVGILLDTLSHQKYTSNQPRSQHANTNPRSPLS